MTFKRPRASSPTSSQKRSRDAESGSKTITLGTEIPSDQDGNDGEFVPVWKQTVTDEHGRRRLHGAFTGGFSAGYFNTVGSKEGWAPKAFVSSRSNRRKDTAQRAEDYMDEEDLAEAAASRELETAQSFATIGRVGESQNDALFGLFTTRDETMGVKIAQKMGWRENQGVGRKITRSAHLGDGQIVESTSTGHLFAPVDSRAMPPLQQDVKRKGLGYQSEARLVVAEAREQVERPDLALSFAGTSTTVKKAVPKKSSFGVGVLNDTGSDDEDPYELGPKITFSKTVGKAKKTKKQSKFVKNAAGEKHIFVAKKLPYRSDVAFFSTSIGHNSLLRGFVLATQIPELSIKRRYPPPMLPPGWQSTKSIDSDASTKEYQSVAHAAKASTLDAKARSSLLGETPLPGKSVFDFIPKEARDRIATLTGKTNLPQGLGQSGPQDQEGPGNSHRRDLWSFVPVLDKTVAAAVLAKGAAGWMPYAEDLKKRTRYVGFLELRAGFKNDLPARDANTPVSDWAKELQEFAHAAQVFKPTTGVMASRFTSSVSSSQSDCGKGASGETLLRQPAAKPEDPAEQAARLGMYGAMTRTSFPFYPSRLLCKRFNVKPPPEVPHGDDEFSGHSFRSRAEEPGSSSAMNQMRHEVLTRGAPFLQRPAWMDSLPEEATRAAVTPTAGVAAPYVEHAMVDVENNDALTQERSSEDVFKAIFGDDEDEDD